MRLKKPSDDWSKDINDLESYFGQQELPDEIRLNKWSNIINTSLFIRSHLQTVKSNNGNLTYLPYLDRLKELRQTLKIIDMKTMICFILLTLTLEASPPAKQMFIIEQAPVVNRYDLLIQAVTTIESQNGKYIYNPKENAVGWFQIRQCRVDHYNELTGNSYSLEDCYDYDLSKEIFLYFARGKDFETASRNWNGSGEMTTKYWNKVKVLL